MAFGFFSSSESLTKPSLSLLVCFLDALLGSLISVEGFLLTGCVSVDGCVVAGGGATAGFSITVPSV